MSAELNGNLTPEEQLTGTLDTSAQLVGSLNIGSGGGGGTDNYNDLSNKPQINNVTLSGNKTTADLGLFSGYIEDLHYTDLIESGTVPYMIYGSQSGHWGMNTGAKLSNISDVAYYGPSQVSNGDVLAISGAGTPNYKWTKTHLGAAAYTNDYGDLDNKPTIPAAQVNSDWNSSSGVSEILNKPTLATVATSGDYDDLDNKPKIPAAQVNSDWNSSSGVSQILNKPLLPDFNTTNPSSLYTVTKTEGEWSFDSIWARKAGNIIYMSMYFKGSGNIVNAGYNAFKGTLSGGPLPIGGATLVSYIDAACMVCTINSSGGITIRITGSSVTLASTNTAGFQGLMLIATS